MNSDNTQLRWLLTILFLGCLNLGYAQKATVQGKVNGEDGIPITAVTVLVVGTNMGTFTDASGSYRLQLPANHPVTLSFSSIGFDSLIYENLQFIPDELRVIDVVLIEKITVLNQIEVVTEPNRRDVSIVQITPRSASLIPSAFGDFTKILSTLPGVVANNELSSSYSVRGGNFDENLIYVNGFEVYRPFLVRAGRQEGLSVVNTDLTREAKFYAGGWSAFYGDKLSSVLDVNYKEPTDTKGSLSLGLLGGSAHVEGSLENDQFSYLVGARHKRGEYLLNTLDVEGEYFPNFTDVQGYFNYKLNPERTKLAMFTSYAQNRYRVEPQTRETEFGTFNQALRFLVAFEGQELLNYDTWQAGLNLEHKLKPDKVLNIFASGVKTWEKEYGDIEGGYRLCDVDKNPGSSSFNECISIRGIGTNYYHARNTLEGTLFNTSIRMEQGLGSGSYLQYGLEYNLDTFKDYLEEYSFIDSADFVEIRTETLSNADTQSNRVAGYFQHNLRAGVTGELHYGFRISYRDLNDQWLFSPRVQYSLKPDWSKDYIFKVAAGLYQQQPLYREMRSYGGLLNTEVKAQQSAHIILGLDHNFSMWARSFKWTAEVYYKYLWDVIPYDVDNVRIRYAADNIAVAYSTGLDMRVSGEFIPGTESWFSMSLLTSKENIEDDGQGYLRRPTDQRLTLAAFFEDHLPNNPSLRVNLGMVYGSGLPFGPPNNFENRAIFKGDSYQRVDIGFSKIFSFKTILPESLRLTFEILNLLGANNTISYSWVQDVSGDYLAVPNTLSNRFLNIKASLYF